jgi:murein DD-endopeptidase MepM/ murein hydrolase activator NlpD
MTHRNVPAFHQFRNPALNRFFRLWIGLPALFLCAAVTACPPAARSAPAEPAPRVSLSSGEVETGGTLLVEVDCRRLPTLSQDVRISLYNQDISIFPHPVKGHAVYAGLLGIPLTAPPGKTALAIEWGPAGHRRVQNLAFKVRPGVYGEETLTVDPRHVRPSPKELERIRREQEELKQIYASGSRSRLWQGRFQIPVPGEMSGPFGTRRLFNGELQSHHTGVDFRAQTGDSVHAAGSGLIRLTKDLFYSGNAVIIDHGAGVFTSYSHLSRIDVKVGQRIEKGQAVGLAGATGRATGPHLHWAVKVNSVNVNPLIFIKVMDLLAGG